ncbi:50S ribosomal protein L17 [bacterium]|nr:MAG: 50S ribosomal protein L17 [candidate division KSB1 bacterium]MCE7942277.1 50S ribosomal protein L17 [Chlorobi bacterium CHB1]MCL4705160.1 50S ribosomal protein L17 [bacterium]MDL1876661.1 50S ribosomal protein L17 [Cytophagia bacterium CHB2]MBC6947855.1 50S ribosomal protein L17 [candidate division KSB1 bacterium]
MRHRKDTKKLGRTSSHRKAMLSNLVSSVIEHKHVRTTTVKAKEARRVVDRMITHAKKNTVAARRLVFSHLRRRDIVKSLFDDIAPKYATRNGGYTRVLKIGRRQGDGAEISILELVGYEGVQLEKQQAAAEKRAERKKRKQEEIKSEAEREAKMEKSEKEE